MIRKSALLVSTGLFAIATPAFAQTAVSNTDSDKQAAKPTPGATEGAATQDQAREQQPIDTGDIVITATRRNQALSDVPMAVSAVTRDNLRNTGATDIRQLNQVAPSLHVFSTSSEGGAASREHPRHRHRRRQSRASKARSASSSTASIARARASA